MLGGLICIAVLSAADLGRCVLPATPIDIDTYRPSFFYRYVKATGIAHIEDASSYEHVWYYGHANSLLPMGERDIVKREPWLLVPLNRPDRAEGLLVLAELPLGQGKLPPDFDPQEIEFEGLLGPMPSDVLKVVKGSVPAATLVTRLQVGLRPSPWISLAVLGWALLTARLGRKLDQGEAGMLSWASLLVGGTYLLWFLGLRFQNNPDANAWSPAIFGMVMASVGHGVYLLMQGRGGESGLSDEAYRAALESQDRYARSLSRPAPPPPHEHADPPGGC